MVYAWTGSGRQLWSQTLPGPNDFSSPVIVDLTGSGADDVVVGSAGGLYALSGATGGFLYHTSASQPINTHSMLNSVAVDDVPGAGWQLFEACGGPKEVTPTGYLYDYPLPARPKVSPPWPMWRAEPRHDGVAGRTPP